MAEDTLDIGKIIKILRVLDNLTQEELARAIGCSRTWLSSLESGGKEPSLRHLKKIANYFDLPLAIFVEGAMEMDQCRRILSDRLAKKILGEDVKSS